MRSSFHPHFFAVLLLLPFLLSMISAMAAPNPVPPTAVAPAPLQVPASIATPSARSEVEMVSRIEAEANAQQAQITAIKEYHSSLLDTVYWSLSTLVTVFALLAGFGWFANFKFYEADKARLKEDFTRMLAEASAKADVKLIASEGGLLEKVDGRLESVAQRLSGDFQAIRSDISALTKNLFDDKATTIQKDKELENRLKELNKTIGVVESNMRRVEEHVWEIKGIPTNKLITQKQSLDAALKSEATYLIDDALERMGDTIQKEILPGGHTLPETMRTSLQSSIAAAASSNPISASAIAELVKLIPVRVLIDKPPA